MVTWDKAQWDIAKGKWGGVVYCLSTDTKPTDNLANGAALIEMDTGKLYFFDGAGNQWLEWGA